MNNICSTQDLPSAKYSRINVENCEKGTSPSIAPSKR